MQNKVDVYSVVHKGIRYALFKLMTQVGSLDVGDDAAVDQVGQELQKVLLTMRLHQRAEDQFLQPLAQKLAAEGASLAAREHEQQTGRLQRLESLFQELRAAPAASEERRTLASRFYAELDTVSAENLVHMRQEEDQLQTRMWESVPTQELAELTARMRGSFTPPEMMQFLTYILPALNPEERTHLLGGMKKNAPPQAFAAVWDLAGRVLAEKDMTSLRQKLGVA